MGRMLIRMVSVVIVACLLSIAGVNGNAIVLQTLFTVLGIVFSISMSVLISFSLTRILNKKIRASLRESMVHTRNMLLVDFSVSTIVAIISLIWDKTVRYTILNYIVIDVMLIGILFITFSLFYEMYTFRMLYKLHTDIEDAIIEEEINGK